MEDNVALTFDRVYDAFRLLEGRKRIAGHGLNRCAMSIVCGSSELQDFGGAEERHGFLVLLLLSEAEGADLTADGPASAAGSPEGIDVVVGGYREVERRLAQRSDVDPHLSEPTSMEDRSCTAADRAARR